MDSTPHHNKEQQQPAGGYFTLDNEQTFAIAQSCGAHALTVFACLSMYADRSGRCYPSLTLIAKVCGINRSTVVRSLKALKRLGVVHREPGKHFRGGTVYRVTRRKEQLVAQNDWLHKAPPLGAESAATRRTERQGTRPKNKTQEQDPKKRAGETVDDDLPEELDTRQFRAAWSDWQKHRREIKKTLTPTTRDRQLKQLARMGSAAAVEAIEQSIAAGWTGIFEPKGKINGKARLKPGPGQRHPADAREQIGEF